MCVHKNLIHSSCQKNKRWQWRQNTRHHGRFGQQFIQCHILIREYVCVHSFTSYAAINVHLPQWNVSCMLVFWIFFCWVGISGGIMCRLQAGGGKTQAISNLFSALPFYIFIYISRDRLWVGESIVTSCGELGGAGRLQWRANSLAMNELSSKERCRLAKPTVESKTKHSIVISEVLTAVEAKSTTFNGVMQCIIR